MSVMLGDAGNSGTATKLGPRTWVYRPEQRERPQLKEVLNEITQNEGDSEDNTDSGPVASNEKEKAQKG
jgi:hypothetical protein